MNLKDISLKVSHNIKQYKNTFRVQLIGSCSHCSLENMTNRNMSGNENLNDTKSIFSHNTNVQNDLLVGTRERFNVVDTLRRNIRKFIMPTSRDECYNEGLRGFMDFAIGVEPPAGHTGSSVYMKNGSFVLMMLCGSCPDLYDRVVGREYAHLVDMYDVDSESPYTPVSDEDQFVDWVNDGTGAALQKCLLYSSICMLFNILKSSPRRDFVKKRMVSVMRIMGIMADNSLKEYSNALWGDHGLSEMVEGIRNIVTFENWTKPYVRDFILTRKVDNELRKYVFGTASWKGLMWIKHFDAMMRKIGYTCLIIDKVFFNCVRKHYNNMQAIKQRYGDASIPFLSVFDISELAVISVRNNPTLASCAFFYLESITAKAAKDPLNRKKREQAAALEAFALTVNLEVQGLSLISKNQFGYLMNGKNNAKREMQKIEDADKQMLIDYNIPSDICFDGPTEEAKNLQSRIQTKMATVIERSIDQMFKDNRTYGEEANRRRNADDIPETFEVVDDGSPFGQAVVDPQTPAPVVQNDVDAQSQNSNQA